MAVNEHNKTPFMQSLSICLSRMVTEGYTEDFKITDRGLESVHKETPYKPEEIQEINFLRFKGETDPDDNAILYVIETSDGTKGTLIDACGDYNDPKVARFIQDVETIKKKVVKN